uniref:G_PROTEIN_RECEP_F1_2 domain-containing protein n=1 Tax=Panagrellus redivivus TaxID=6233 RepID=A0A7E4V755_PANRE
MLGGFIVYLTPVVTCFFYRRHFAWKYDPSAAWHQVYIRVDFHWTTSMMGLSLLNYTFIVIKMKSLKLTSTGKSRKQEIRVCIQAVFLCIWCTFVQFHWYYKTSYMPDSRYASFFSNFIWIVNCTTNPTLCLTLNLSIRKAFFDFINLKRKKSKVVTVIPYLSRINI